MRIITFLEFFPSTPPTTSYIQLAEGAEEEKNSSPTATDIYVIISYTTCVIYNKHNNDMCEE